MTQCRDGGCWLGLCCFPGGSRDSGKSHCRGGRQEASACPWPAASQLACVPRQPPQRAAALTPGSAWSFFTVSQLCPHCPLACGSIWPQSSVEDVCSEQMSVWCGQSAAKTSPPQGAQGSVSTSLALGRRVRADMSQACMQMGSGMLEELGSAASP